MYHGSSWLSWGGHVWPATPYFHDNLQREVWSSRPDKRRTECEDLSCVAAQCHLQNVAIQYIHNVCLRTIATHTFVPCFNYLCMYGELLFIPLPLHTHFSSTPPLSSPPFLQRPPIEWLADPTAVAFCFPYVLAMSEERSAIHVYNLVDAHQRCYQTLPFQGTIGGGGV